MQEQVCQNGHHRVNDGKFQYPRANESQGRKPGNDQGENSQIILLDTVLSLQHAYEAENRDQQKSQFMIVGIREQEDGGQCDQPNMFLIELIDLCHQRQKPAMPAR